MADTPARAVLLFEGFRLDLGRGALTGADGAEMPLRPKAFDVLRRLAENAGRLVTRDELLGAVWPGVFVTDDNVTVCVAQVRRALGGDARHPIRTVQLRGYLFEATVSRAEVPAPAATEEAAAAKDPQGGGPGQRPAPPPPDRPSLAVLLFAAHGGDPEQRHLADGVAEDVIAALSRLRWLFVVARGSSFAYRGADVDLRRVGRELGVRYVLGGGVRRSGGRVRVSAWLAEAETGAQVWAERLEGGLGDLFALQDELAVGVAAAVQPALAGAELERSVRRPPGDLGALEGIAKLTVSDRNKLAARSWRDDVPACHLPRLPLPCRDHRPRRVAVPRLRPEPAGRGADPGRAGHRGDARERVP